MKKEIRFSIITMFVISLAMLFTYCGGGGGGSTGEDGSDLLNGTASPASGSAITSSDSIVINYNKSMSDTSQLFSGSLYGKTDGGVWSSGALTNDTLTISPNTGWFIGNPQTLDVTASDMNGKPVTLNLNYTINSSTNIDGDNSPANLDCNDNDSAMYPENVEICDSKDNNCNGYIDDGNCDACNSGDTDGDGVSECDGDCAPDNGAIYPGATELCDGLDNDCNIYTIENCEVGQSCNIDDDGNSGNDPDVCASGLLCALELDANGLPSGNYSCTGLCNSSETGASGEFCGANQKCSYKRLRSANINACAQTLEVLGSNKGGEPCVSDNECRSGDCSQLYVGPGVHGRYCVDACGSDSYCSAADTNCRIVRGDPFDTLCWNTSDLPTGAKTVGESCTTDNECDHGLCALIDGVNVCTEPCVSDTDCGTGFTCTLLGEQISSSLTLPDPASSSCTVDTDCETGLNCIFNQCSFILTNTVGMCVLDETGQGTLAAGAACTSNLECRSNYCEADSNVCLEICGSDTNCPSGLSCELQDVETLTDGTGVRQATKARVCSSSPISGVLKRK